MKCPFINIIKKHYVRILIRIHIGNSNFLPLVVKNNVMTTTLGILFSHFQALELHIMINSSLMMLIVHYKVREWEIFVFVVKNSWTTTLGILFSHFQVLEFHIMINSSLMMLIVHYKVREWEIFLAWTENKAIQLNMQGPVD